MRKLLLILTLASSTALAATSMQVISLNHRTADELLPTLRQAMGDRAEINAYGNQLIVRAEPQAMGDLQALLQQLDTAARQLLITVDTQNSGDLDAQGYSMQGSIKAGDVQIDAGNPGRNRVRVIRRSTGNNQGGVQQIQAAEGYPALIQVGQRIPVPVASPYGYPPSVQYQNVTQGVYVTASLSGENVHITLSSNNDRLDRRRPGVIDAQDINTRVSGKLGEWINVGGLNQNTSRNDNAALSRHYSTQGANDMTLRIKVDVAN